MLVCYDSTEKWKHGRQHRGVQAWRAKRWGTGLALETPLLTQKYAVKLQAEQKCFQGKQKEQRNNM